jgi:two-component system, cell cycle sensor histidine kinase and response regulator CckA
MNRDSLHVLHLEASAEDHELVRRRAWAPDRTLTFERAANRVEFESALNRGDIDLILADHCVAGYEGMAALEAAQIRQPNVPYIVISGSIGEDRAAECLKRGARDFVHKDRLERLPAAILEALNKPGESDRVGLDEREGRKMELVGRLTGGVAHDFSNLLTIISGYVSMLLDKESLPPEVLESLKRVFTASRQATVLVRQLLLFSRARTPRREVVDLNTEIEAAAAMIGRLLGKSIIVEFEPSPEAPRVSADTGDLEQALMNIAVNARDAMPRGGRLNISIAMHARGSDESALASKWDHACITVHDSGKGIPAAVLPRIFEPYFTSKEDGRGTGLPTALEIVKEHGGWIDVDTEMGVGTMFRIYLPLAQVDVAAASAAASGPTPRIGKATILLVEDEANVREFAVAVLQNEGYNVLQGKDGEHALEVWQWHSAKIDLLLTDVVLPGEISGPQLGAMLLGEKPSLRVILTTGYSSDSVTPLSSNGVLSLVLGKPYTMRLLIKAVRDALA